MPNIDTCQGKEPVDERVSVMFPCVLETREGAAGSTNLSREPDLAASGAAMDSGGVGENNTERRVRCEGEDEVVVVVEGRECWECAAATASESCTRGGFLLGVG